MTPTRVPEQSYTAPPSTRPPVVRASMHVSVVCGRIRAALARTMSQKETPSKMQGPTNSSGSSCTEANVTFAPNGQHNLAYLPRDSTTAGKAGDGGPTLTFLKCRRSPKSCWRPCTSTWLALSRRGTSSAATTAAAFTVITCTARRKAFQAEVGQPEGGGGFSRASTSFAGVLTPSAKSNPPSWGVPFTQHCSSSALCLCPTPPLEFCFAQRIVYCLGPSVIWRPWFHYE